MINKTEQQTIKEYANSHKIVCLNCNKKIERGLCSWCSFDCEKEFIKKYNLRTQQQIKEKVFELIKGILKDEKQ